MSYWWIAASAGTSAKCARSSILKRTLNKSDEDLDDIGDGGGGGNGNGGGRSKRVRFARTCKLNVYIKESDLLTLQSDATATDAGTDGGRVDMSIVPVTPNPSAASSRVVSVQNATYGLGDATLNESMAIDVVITDAAGESSIQTITTATITTAAMTTIASAAADDEEADDERDDLSTFLAAADTQVVVADGGGTATAAPSSVTYNNNDSTPS